MLKWNSTTLKVHFIPSSSYIISCVTLATCAERKMFYKISVYLWSKRRKIQFLSYDAHNPVLNVTLSSQSSENMLTENFHLYVLYGRRHTIFPFSVFIVVCQTEDTNTWTKLREQVNLSTSVVVKGVERFSINFYTVHYEFVEVDVLIYCLIFS